VKARDIAPSAFHSAGLTTDPNLDCLGGDEWVNTSADSPVGYYRDPLGEVHLTGVIDRCGTPTNQFFTLPVGFRPAVADGLILPMLKTSGAAGVMTNLNVYDNGGVWVNGSGPGDEFSLNGLSFRCAPSEQEGCP
jgi:hypothetical protein